MIVDAIVINIIIIIIIIIKALYGGKSFGLGPVGGASWGEASVAKGVCFMML